MILTGRPSAWRLGSPLGELEEPAGTRWEERRPFEISLHHERTADRQTRRPKVAETGGEESSFSSAMARGIVSGSATDPRLDRASAKSD